MRYTTSTDSEGLTAALAGRFTFHDHQTFRGLTRLIEDAKGARVLLDLEAVEFIDSAALGMMLVAHDACLKAGLAFGVRHPRGQVRRTLEIASIGSIFPIAD